MSSTTTSETHLWTTTPSQLTNIKVYLASALLIIAIISIHLFILYKTDNNFWVLYLFIIPIVIRAFWAYLIVKCTKYELTTERFKRTSGVFNVISDELELYRIKKHLLELPWYLRLFGLGNILLITSDKTDDTIVLKAIHNSKQRRQNIRDQTEICRKRKGVQEFDLR